MRGSRSITALFVAMALVCASSPSAAGKSMAAPTLFAEVSGLNEELSLLDQASSPLGVRGVTPLVELRFQNHDGYTIRVIGFGQTVALSVIHRDGKQRPSTATYLAHGKVTPGSIRASFADRGRIAFHFRPNGRKLRATRRAGCGTSSNDVVADLGLFVGELRFRGEGGYTSAEVHRVHGGSIDFAALAACLLGREAPGGDPVPPLPRAPLGPSVLRLLAVNLDRTAPSTPSVDTHPSNRPKSTALLTAQKLPLSRTVFAALTRGRDRTRFLALDARSEGSIGILRLVTVWGPPSSFALDSALSAATVKPPAPFSGKAAYQHGAGSTKSWTGSLAVSLLGAPNVPLTGTPFSTQLVQSW